MARALQSGLRDGGLKRGGLHAGIGNGNIFAIASLDLNFARYKNTGSLVTFTRASTATFVGSDGVLQTATTNAPRFDHNPTTGESLGLLVEEARTNLLLQSENFSTTWTLSGLLAFGSGSTLNAVTAPDGTSTADLITEDTATSTHIATQGSLSLTSGITYTVSCFVKRGTGSRNAAIALRAAAFSGAPRVNIDLSTGTTSLTGSGGTIGSQACLGGWWCVSLTATATATVTSFVDIGLVSGASTLSYAGDGTSGIYVWGAQLEAGAFPTSYIPTTTATVTRAADVASITGTNFSSFYNQTEGTMFAEYNRPSAVTGLRSIGAVSDSGFNNRMTFRTDSAIQITPFVTTGGVNQASFPLAFNSGVNSKAALAYSNNNFNAGVNGITGTNDTSGTVPVVDRLSIGAVLSAETSCSYIRRLAYWPTRLADNTLQAISQP